MISTVAQCSTSCRGSKQLYAPFLLLRLLLINTLLYRVLITALQQRYAATQGRTIGATRTSENAFVTWTPTAMTLKKRIFALLGIEQFRDTWADGLQVQNCNVHSSNCNTLSVLKLCLLDLAVSIHSETR